MKPEIRGYGYAFLATTAGSTVYIFSKAALNEVSLAQFGVYWFTMAILWNSLFTLRSAEHRRLPKLSGNMIKVLITIGLIELVATGSFYMAISISENPSIPSFLRNLEYIFVTLMGVILLGERFVGIQKIGVVLTFAGAMVISYQKGGTPASYLSGSAGLMLVSTLFYGIRTITVKKNIQRVSPTILAINRAIFLLGMATVLLLVWQQNLKIPGSALLNIMAGSFLGPFLTSLGQYSALKYIPASRAAIIQSSTALFVVLGVFIYFGRLPMLYQVIGGLLTVAGVILLFKAKRN
ncbi:MAG: DMT family transporter [Bacteroidales bacterium]|nr:DMT family transporter [Bacteroidales bacterium]